MDDGPEGVGMTDPKIDAAEKRLAEAREALRDAAHDWHACRDTAASEPSFDAWKAAEERYEAAAAQLDRARLSAQVGSLTMTVEQEAALRTIINPSIQCLLAELDAQRAANAALRAKVGKVEAERDTAQGIIAEGASVLTLRAERDAAVRERDEARAWAGWPGKIGQIDSWVPTALHDDAIAAERKQNTERIQAVNAMAEAHNAMRAAESALRAERERQERTQAALLASDAFGDHVMHCVTCGETAVEDCPEGLDLFDKRVVARAALTASQPEVETILTPDRAEQVEMLIGFAMERVARALREGPGPEDHKLAIALTALGKRIELPSPPYPPGTLYRPTLPLPASQPERTAETGERSSVRLIFVVNGQPITQAVPLDLKIGAARNRALAAAKETGRPPDQWETRAGDGAWLDPDALVSSLGITDGARLYVTLKVAAGGSGGRTAEGKGE